ncbi:hypothetical protein J6W34_04695 [bacterium]|nr:hypothetical protein [bacterium]
MKTFRYIFILLFIFISLIVKAEYPSKHFLYTNHNRVNTCKNLLQKYTLDELSAMISSGNFDDIYVGDYIEMTMTSSFTTEKVRWIVAAINYFLKKGGDGNAKITTNHIVLVAESSFVTMRSMNSTDYTSGGFAGSEMYVTTLPIYDTAITEAFGSSHILEYQQLLTNSVDTTAPSMAGNLAIGASNNSIFCSGLGTNPHKTKLCLMNEVQLLGTMGGSSSYIDVGINNSQFPLFAQIPELIATGGGFNNTSASRRHYWLSSIYSSSSYMRITAAGLLSSTVASSKYGVRPYFLFK